jgi:hypothetical protein
MMRAFVPCGALTASLRFARFGVQRFVCVWCLFEQYTSSKQQAASSSSCNTSSSTNVHSSRQQRAATEGGESNAQFFSGGTRFKVARGFQSRHCCCALYASLLCLLVMIFDHRFGFWSQLSD